MDANTLASIAGVILSLVFAYVPGVKEWYGKLDATQKAGTMAILLIAVALGVFAASCGQVVSVGITCDKQGAVGLVQILVAALIANQSTFLIAVRPNAPPVKM